MAKVSDGYQISLTDTEILKILLNFININNRNNYSHNNNYYRNLVEFDTIQSTPGHPLFRSNRLNYSKVIDVKPTGSMCMCSTIPIRPTTRPFLARNHFRNSHFTLTSAVIKFLAIIGFGLKSMI